MGMGISLVFALAAGLLLWTEGAALSAPATKYPAFKLAEEEGISSGRFIAPNESGYRYFKPYLHGKKGVLVSVGTFRSLIDANFGDFDHVIQLDYDQLATQFNRANIQLLATSKDRYEYIARVLIPDGAPDLVKKLRTGKLDHAGFLLEARNRIESYLRTGRYSAKQRSVAASLAKALGEPLPIEGMPSLRLGLISFFRQALSAPIDDAPYFASNTGFEKLRIMALEGRITAVNGSLSGQKTMASIAKRTRALDLEISVVDLSNASDKLIEYSHETLEPFLTNMARLPFSKDAVVLFTVDIRNGGSGLAQVSDGGWAAYLGKPAQEFLAAAKEGAFQSKEAFMKFAAAPVGIYSPPEARCLATARNALLQLSKLDK